LKIVTEMELRREYRMEPFECYRVGKDHRLTPAATEFLNERKIKILNDEGSPSLGSQHRRLMGVSSVKSTEGSASKPEEYTHLNASQLVAKTSERIVFRGKLDSLEADFISVIAEYGQYETVALKEELGIILGYLRKMMRADVRDEPLAFIDFKGWDDAQIRERSHYPNRYYKVDHFTPDPSQGVLMAKLNQLRGKVRELEIVALQAFFNPETKASVRPDITMALNRLSSLMYILMCRHLEEIQSGKVL